MSLLREPEDDSDVLIECRNVCKSFGDKHILRGVSLKVNFHLFPFATACMHFGHLISGLFYFSD